MNKYKRKSISVETKKYCHLAQDNDFIEITEWHNGEGFDVSLSGKYRELYFNLSYGEFKALIKLVKNLYMEE